MTTTSDFADIARRAAERAQAQGGIAAEAATLAAKATASICEADALIQQAIGLLADPFAGRGAVEAALEALHEAGQRTSTARYLACRAAEISAKPVE
jgi:hypothetical protein